MKKSFISLLATTLVVGISSLHADEVSSSAQGSGASGVLFVEAKAEVDRLRKTKPDSAELHSAETRLEMQLHRQSVDEDNKVTRHYYASWREHQEQLSKDAEAAAKESKQ